MARLAGGMPPPMDNPYAQNNRLAAEAHDSDVVHCITRMPEMAPQSNLVHKYMFDYEAYEARQGILSPTYPVYQESDFDLKPGELAFCYPTRSEPGITQTNDPNIPVFSAFNGLRARKDPIVFAGFVDFGHDMKSHRDDVAVTLARVGTRTLFNTGSCTIRHGQLVFWDFPKVRMLGGRAMPTVIIDGINNTKFVARTCGMDNNKCRSIFKQIKLDLEGKFRSLGGNARIQVDAVSAAMRNFAEDIWPLYSIHNRSATPHDIMALTDAEEKMAEREDNNLDPIRRWVGIVLRTLGVPNNFWDPRYLSRHLTEMEEQIRSLENAAADRGNKACRLDVDTILEPMADDEDDAYRRGVEGGAELFNRSLLADHSAKCAFDFVDMIKSRTLGTCLNDSPPGGRLDTAVGFWT